MVLAGDSVPLLLGATLTEQRGRPGGVGAQPVSAGLPPARTVGPIRGTEGNVRADVTDCAPAAYRQVAQRPDVAMVLFGEFPNEAVELERRWSMPCERLPRRSAAGSTPWWPTGSRDAPVVLVTAPGTSLSWVLERVAPGMDERVRCTNQVLQDIADDTPGVTIVDLAA